MERASVDLPANGRPHITTTSGTLDDGTTGSPTPAILPIPPSLIHSIRSIVQVRYHRASLTSMQPTSAGTWCPAGRPKRIVDVSDKGAPAEGTDDRTKDKRRPLETRDPVTTSHSIRIGRSTLEYDVTFGALPITDEYGEVEAHIYFTRLYQKG